VKRAHDEQVKGKLTWPQRIEYCVAFVAETSLRHFSVHAGKPVDAVIHRWLRCLRKEISDWGRGKTGMRIREIP